MLGIAPEIKLNTATLAWEFYDNKTLLATKPALFERRKYLYDRF